MHARGASQMIDNTSDLVSDAINFHEKVNKNTMKMIVLIQKTYEFDNFYYFEI